MRRLLCAVVIAITATGIAAGAGHANVVRPDGLFHGPTADQECALAKESVPDPQLTAFCDRLDAQTFQLITVPTTQVPRFLMLRAEAGTLDRLS
ncbi:hypothetical protein ACFO5K_14285 [Nocardia halotolerans]|uniref:Uncharacterized protein n=1 Tax=Nocardia halotolerans TaxID=1755878 RepID=A0ABV8VGV4_9NOCA